MRKLAALLLCLTAGCLTDQALAPVRAPDRTLRNYVGVLLLLDERVYRYPEDSALFRHDTEKLTGDMIESLQVIKGTTASALYGRSACAAIVIRTKPAASSKR
jgi:hypothetical protein